MRTHKVNEVLEQIGFAQVADTASFEKLFSIGWTGKGRHCNHSSLFGLNVLLKLETVQNFV